LRKDRRKLRFQLSTASSGIRKLTQFQLHSQLTTTCLDSRRKRNSTTVEREEVVEVVEVAEVEEVIEVNQDREEPPRQGRDKAEEVTIRT